MHEWIEGIGSVPVEHSQARQVYAPIGPYAELKKHIEDHADYAWAWHCNLAMPVMDELGCTHEQANRAGARLMSILFGVDITKHRYWAYPESVTAATAAGEG